MTLSMSVKPQAFVRLCAIFALVGTLAACGTSPTTMVVNFKTSPQLNMNSESQPSPTVVRLYDLKSADTFNAASFFDLFDNDTAKLGNDMVGRRLLEMEPGKDATQTWEAPTGTQFLGVLIGYRDPDGNGWRLVTPVVPEKKNQITIVLDPRSATVAPPPHRFLGIF